VRKELQVKKLTLSEPVFEPPVTIAKPVVGFIATSPGDEPAGNVRVALEVIVEAPLA